MQLVVIIANIFFVIPKVILYLRYDCGESGEKWSEGVYISVSGINWFASISEYEVVFAN